MKRSRNRLTPFLVIILIVLIWILVAVVAYKFINKHIRHVTKLKLDDDLVQELYSYVSDDDIILFSDNKYTRDTLPSSLLISNASKFMTLEDVELTNDNKFTIDYDSLDSAIKMAYGPDIKYDLSNIKEEVTTYLELNDHRLVFDMEYDKSSKNYVGTYHELLEDNSVQVKHELVRATKTDTVNLIIGYIFYKQDTNYQICSDAKCSEIIREVDNIDNLEYENYITVSLDKESDDVYYYHSNS